MSRPLEYGCAGHLSDPQEACEYCQINNRLFTAARESRWAYKKMMCALDETRKRVSAMSDTERDQLWHRGIAMVFPGGWWACAHGHPSVCVAKGSPCKICAAQEDPPNAASSATPERKRE